MWISGLELMLHIPKPRAEELESHVPWSTAPLQGREIFGYELWPPEMRCLIEGTCWALRKKDNDPETLAGSYPYNRHMQPFAFQKNKDQILWPFRNDRCQGTHCCCMCCEQGPAGTKSIGTLSEEQTTQKLWNWGQTLHPDKLNSFCTCEMGLDLKTLLLWPCWYWKPCKRTFGCNHGMFACWCGFACHDTLKANNTLTWLSQVQCSEKLQLGVCANVWIFPPRVWLETGQTHVGSGGSTFQMQLGNQLSYWCTAAQQRRPTARVMLQWAQSHEIC